jgi:hypothetical protein
MTMKHTITTAGEIAVVNLLKNILGDHEDAINTTKVESLDESGVYIYVTLKFTYFTLEYEVCFRVSDIREDDDDEYTGDFEIEVSEDWYVGLRSFDSSAKNFWIAVLNQATRRIQSGH